MPADLGENPCGAENRPPKASAYINTSLRSRGFDAVAFQKMSDKEILHLHNKLIRAREKFAAEYEHIA
ncbi:hypothetical protein MYX65_09545, partial [Acidobacteria bacterium AH-259-L09]|nr:hypothetical protein [Acidobacteria bacterium AH-259-L09]